MSEDGNQPLIYFASAVERVRFPVKIGRSTVRGLRNRLQSLQTGQPYELDFMFVGGGAPTVEKELHREFAAIRLKGEWFKRTRDLERFIADLVGYHPDWRAEAGLPLPPPPFEENWQMMARQSREWAIASNLERAKLYPAR